MSVLESESCYAVKILKRLGADIEEMKEKTGQILREQKHRKELGYDDFDNEGAAGGGAFAPKGTEGESAEDSARSEDLTRKEKTQIKDYNFSEKKKSAPKKNDGARKSSFNTA